MSDLSIRVLFRHQVPCNTRWKSWFRIQCPTLAIDPRRCKYSACPNRQINTLPVLLHSQIKSFLQVKYIWSYLNDVYSIFNRSDLDCTRSKNPAHCHKPFQTDICSKKSN